MKLTLPLPPNMANNMTIHWASKRKRRNTYMVLATSKHHKRLPQPLKRARISVTVFLYNLMDEDNLMARLKWPVDWLVEREFIVDDSLDHLVWDPPRQAIDRKDQRVEITLEALDD